MFEYKCNIIISRAIYLMVNMKWTYYFMKSAAEKCKHFSSKFHHVTRVYVLFMHCQL